MLNGQGAKQTLQVSVYSLLTCGKRLRANRRRYQPKHWSRTRRSQKARMGNWQCTMASYARLTEGTSPGFMRG